MDARVRAATENDLVRIAEMTRDLTVHMGAFEWTVDSHLKHVTRRFQNPRYIHLVTEVGNEVVGFTGAELKSTRTAYMMKAYVEPDHRRKGVMTMMEGELIRVLKSKGVDKIDLKVFSSNIEGKRTWDALGYSTVSETMRKEI